MNLHLSKALVYIIFIFGNILLCGCHNLNFDKHEKKVTSQEKTHLNNQTNNTLNDNYSEPNLDSDSNILNNTLDNVNKTKSDNSLIKANNDNSIISNKKNVSSLNINLNYNDKTNNGNMILPNLDSIPNQIGFPIPQLSLNFVSSKSSMTNQEYIDNSQNYFYPSLITQFILNGSSFQVNNQNIYFQNQSSQHYNFSNTDSNEKYCEEQQNFNQNISQSTQQSSKKSNIFDPLYHLPLSLRNNYYYLLQNTKNYQIDNYKEISFIKDEKIKFIYQNFTMINKITKKNGYKVNTINIDFEKVHYFFQPKIINNNIYLEITKFYQKPDLNFKRYLYLRNKKNYLKKITKFKNKFSITNKIYYDFTFKGSQFPFKKTSNIDIIYLITRQSNKRKSYQYFVIDKRLNIVSEYFFIVNDEPLQKTNLMYENKNPNLIENFNHYKLNNINLWYKNIFDNIREQTEKIIMITDILKKIKTYHRK